MIQIVRIIGGNLRIDPPHGSGEAHLLLPNKQLPAQNAGGRYKTHE
jgi:hypothetical protein